MRDLINKSIQRKFLAIMLIALVAVNGPLLALFAAVSSSTIEREVHYKKQAILDANSKALSKPLWDFDFANLAKVAQTIALDPDIAFVEIFDQDQQLVASAPRGAGAVANLQAGQADIQHQEISYSVDDRKVKVGALRIVYLTGRMQAAIWKSVGQFATLFVASTIAVLLVALFTNRLMVVRPLSKLTKAIEATGRLGKRRRVDWQSPDEIGQVVYNFNEMQDRLEAEEEELKSAHQRLSNLYNNTPVMLYSVNSEDKIVGISDYWLRATGYEYDEVIGRQFKEFICDVSLGEYAKKRNLETLAAGDNSEAYCRFRKSDGSIVDVLISETADLGHRGKKRRSLSVMTDITALKAAETEIRRRAQTDTLTGLANRAGFSMGAEQAITAAEAQQGKLAILFFDLDRFKWVNDNLGHHAGDDALKTVADRISPLLKADDLFARLGGDEFAILLKVEDTENRAIDLAARINAILSKPFKLEERTLNVTASVGIAFYPDNARTAHELLKFSDVAMYSQKNKGRNGYSLFDEQMGREAGRNLEIEAYIIDGLKNDWFELHFQPIIDMESSKAIGFEGLLRLNHPTEGILLPREIIAVAEENGSILDVGDRVLELGLTQLDELCERTGIHDAYLTLNLSAAQFLPSLPTKLATLLMASKVRPERLVLEITESALMQQNPELEGIFEDVRILGCRFALDDFGTGYSSLSYLSRFPVDFVKIDRSFSQSLGGANGCTVSQKARALVIGIATMAHQLDLTIVAEGIETEAQFEGLKEMDIDAGQGFLFGKPKPLEEYLPESERNAARLRLVSG